MLAQQNIPGIIMSVPPANPPPAPPPPPAAVKEAPAAKPKTVAPKPKPKTEPSAAAKRAAATASADADGAAPVSGGVNAGRAAIKVNGEPITSYEIEQRARLMSLQANIGERAQANLKRMVSSDTVNQRWKQIVENTIKANPGKGRDDIMKILEARRAEMGQTLQRQAVESAKASVLPELRKKAREELIEEAVKMQEARRVGVKPDDKEVEGFIDNLAQNNKMTGAQFQKHFAGMGVDVATLRAKFRASLSWAEVIRRKYSHLANPNQREIDRLVGNVQGGDDDVEFQLQRIVMAIPAKIDQRLMAQKFVEAEQLQKSFSGCKSMPVLASKSQGARFENIGARKPTNFQEPTRTLLANAKQDEMLPPSVTSTGIELIAVCGRKVVKADEKRRAEAASEIRQKEFEIQARRLLRDLQQDAIIENIGQ